MRPSTRWIVVVVTVMTGILFFVRIARRHSRSSRNTKRIHSATKVTTPSLDSAVALPKFIMLMGIPGSGKSTWARQYVQRCDASFLIISSDDVRKSLTGSVDDQSRNAEVWEVVLAKCQASLKAGRNVILDGTNTNTVKRRRFVSELPPCIRSLKMFSINKTVAKTRIEKDLAVGVERSSVPDSVIDRIYRQYTEAVSLIHDEGWKSML